MFNCVHVNLSERNTLSVGSRNATLQSNNNYNNITFLLFYCFISANILTHHTTSIADTPGIHKTAVGVGGRKIAYFLSVGPKNVQLINSYKTLQTLHASMRLFFLFAG